jgi:DNA ligase-1
MKRQPVMLASKHDGGITGKWSEKLDGQRAFWIPTTRGKRVVDVPFANIIRSPRKAEWIASGLWSRSFAPIMAPAWWLDRLPQFCLDGELWMGRGMFQATESIVRMDNPDQRWEKILYKVIDAPKPNDIVDTGDVEFGSGASKRTLIIKEKTIAPFIPGILYSERMNALSQYLPFDSTIVSADVNVPIAIVSMTVFKEYEELEAFEKQIFSLGGEGTIRRIDWLYTATRSKYMQKRKPYEESEATVIGYTDGKEKYTGMCGALIVRWKTIMFELGTGLTDADRRSPPKIGSLVTFRYRELSDTGVPKEGRYKAERTDLV